MKSIFSIVFVVCAWMALAPLGSELPDPLQSVLPPLDEGNAVTSPLLAAAVVMITLFLIEWITTRFPIFNISSILKEKCPGSIKEPRQ